MVLMNARKFLDLYGRERAKEVALSAGTTWQYFYQIANRWRRPSAKLAVRLSKASNGELTLIDLVTTETRDEEKARLEANQ